jgi:hypothetical protein
MFIIWKAYTCFRLMGKKLNFLETGMVIDKANLKKRTLARPHM